MNTKLFSVIVGLLVIGFAYYLYSPLPSNAVEPWKQMGIRAVVRVLSHVARAGEMCGIASSINITRFFLEAGNIVRSYDTGLKIQDVEFSGVPVRVYTPNNVVQMSPALIYIHGGGWALLSVDSYDFFVRHFAKESGIVAISIEYRRAPEHVFPVPLEDCLSAVKYFISHAEDFGVNPHRIAISGDSAGGNLAMAVALNLSTDTSNNHPLKSQILIYPALQAFDFQLPSYQAFYDESGPFIISTHGVARAFMWHATGNNKTLFNKFLTNNHTSSALKRSKYSNFVSEKHVPKEFFDQNYIETKNDYGDETVCNGISDWLLNPLFAPLMATDQSLSKLPPTYILLAEYDVLRDDGYILENRLRQLNHKVELSYWEGLQHGFLLFGLEASERAMNEIIKYVHENI